MKRLNNLTSLVSMALVAYAVYLELQKPAEERTWHGSIAELVPYDFRVPTVTRAMARVWNLDDERVFMPTIFGVGWTINWAAVVAWLKNMRREEPGFETA